MKDDHVSLSPASPKLRKEAEAQGIFVIQDLENALNSALKNGNDWRAHAIGNKKHLLSLITNYVRFGAGHVDLEFVRGHLYPSTGKALEGLGSDWPLAMITHVLPLNPDQIHDLNLTLNVLRTRADLDRKVSACWAAWSDHQAEMRLHNPQGI